MTLKTFWNSEKKILGITYKIKWLVSGTAASLMIIASIMGAAA